MKESCRGFEGSGDQVKAVGSLDTRPLESLNPFDLI